MSLELKDIAGYEKMYSCDRYGNIYTTSTDNPYEK